MRRSMMLVILGVAVLAGAALLVYAGDEPASEMKMMEMPFGGAADVAFAEGLWTAMDGYTDWPMASGYYTGGSPHGDFIRMYYGLVTVEGVPYHVIVKDNFGGEGATLETVADSPADYLMAVTVMLQRERGYDKENKDWFWVKYGPDGAIGRNDMSVAMAGRVAKGMAMGCIACHAKAAGGDYAFFNDTGVN